MARVLQAAYITQKHHLGQKVVLALMEPTVRNLLKAISLVEVIATNQEAHQDR